MYLRHMKALFRTNVVNICTAFQQQQLGLIEHGIPNHFSLISVRRGRTAALYLYLSLDSGAVHPTGYVHRVSPDVILRSSGPNHSGYHRSHVDS